MEEGIAKQDGIIVKRMFKNDIELKKGEKIIVDENTSRISNPEYRINKKLSPSILPTEDKFCTLVERIINEKNR